MMQIRGQLAAMWTKCCGIHPLELLLSCLGWSRVQHHYLSEQLYKLGTIHHNTGNALCNHRNEVTQIIILYNKSYAGVAAAKVEILKAEAVQRHSSHLPASRWTTLGLSIRTQLVAPVGVLQVATINLSVPFLVSHFYYANIGLLLKQLRLLPLSLSHTGTLTAPRPSQITLSLSLLELRTYCGL